MGYKIKRILVGTQQVRPTKYEYSYDFRGKTTTQLANDGWTNTSSLTTWANWVTASSWTKIYNQLSWLGTAMANAKKLTMTMLMYDAWSVTTGSVAWVTLTTWTDAYTQTWFYTDRDWAWAMCGSATEVIDKSQQIYNTQWDYTLSAVFDFVNKTVSVVFPSVYTGSASLTDAWITTAKTNNTVWCPLNNDRYVKTISILIEK